MWGGGEGGRKWLVIYSIVQKGIKKHQNKSMETTPIHFDTFSNDVTDGGILRCFTVQYSDDIRVSEVYALVQLLLEIKQICISKFGDLKSFVCAENVHGTSP